MAQHCIKGKRIRNTLLAEVFDECRDSFRIYSKTGYKKTAVKCSMFYNSLF